MKALTGVGLCFYTNFSFASKLNKIFDFGLEENSPREYLLLGLGLPSGRMNARQMQAKKPWTGQVGEESKTVWTELSCILYWSRLRTIIVNTGGPKDTDERGREGKNAAGRVPRNRQGGDQQWRQREEE